MQVLPIFNTEESAVLLTIWRWMEILLFVSRKLKLQASLPLTLIYWFSSSFVCFPPVHILLQLATQSVIEASIWMTMLGFFCINDLLLASLKFTLHQSSSSLGTGCKASVAWYEPFCCSAAFFSCCKYCIWIWVLLV